MNAMAGKYEKPVYARLPQLGRVVLMATGLCGVLALPPTITLAQEPASAIQAQQPAPMPSMKEQSGKAESQSPGTTGSMGMGSMQGSSVPQAARDPNAYSDGYKYTNMPGMEKADQLTLGTLVLDQLEFTHSGEGGGVAWDTYAWYGGDKQKLWLRSEGDSANGKVDFTTSAEALWWRPFSPFWATVLGVHQDFGPGSRTALAFGVQGLAPYWFDVEATGFVDYNGRFSARLKGSYDVRFTNRLILTPELESNLYSKANLQRGIGAGMADIEPQLRLRYEFSRKFAPYIGVDWERLLGDTASLNARPGGQTVSDVKFVVGLHIWH
jgi:copper resistance protein B